MEDGQGVLLFKEKQISIILTLTDKTQEWNLTTVSKASKATYVHTSRFVARCEKMGIIHVVKHGKIKALSLTPKGNEIAEGIVKIVERLKPIPVEPAQPPLVEKK